MATNLSRLGFLPFSDTEGSAPALKRVKVASNNATAIFKGDCVVIGTAGNWTLATAGSGVSAVSLAAEYYSSTTLSRISGPYLPASTVYSSTAFDTGADTDQSFISITNSPVTDRFVTSYSTSTPALTDLTKNANFVANAGTTFNGLSGHVLDQTTINTTNTLDFRIDDIVRNVLSDPTQSVALGGLQAGVKVQINRNPAVGVPDIAGATGA